MKYALILMSLMTMSACSVHLGDKKDEGDFSTKLTQYGCTNEYKAGSKSDLCSQLMDDSKDQCGMRGMREEAYENSCGSHSKVTPTQHAPLVEPVAVPAVTEEPSIPVTEDAALPDGDVFIHTSGSVPQ